MVNLNEGRTAFLAKILPYLCLFAVACALIFYLVTGNADKSVKGLLAYGIPVILASGIAIWRVRKSQSRESQSIPPPPPHTPSPIPFISRSFSHLALGFTLLYIISLILLFISETRPFAYFFLIPVMAGLIFLEILGAEKVRSRRSVIILAQIFLLFLNVVWSVNLKYPLYYGGWDIPSHMIWIDSLVQRGHVTDYMSYYKSFPLFHIFIAEGIMLTGMATKMSYFIFNGLIFATAVPIIYILISKLTKDDRIALGAALCYSLSGSIIVEGTYLVTRSIAWFLCLLLLYLLVQKKPSLQFTILAILIIPSLILTHQTTLAQFAIVLVIFIIVEHVLYRRSHIHFNYIILFTCAFLTYWTYLCFPFFQSIVEIIAGPKGSAMGVALATKLPLTQVPIIMSLSQQIDYTILLFFAVLGALTILHETRHKFDIGYSFAIFSLLAIPFFIPQFFYLFSGKFMFYRTPTLFMVFVAFVMAKGILLFAEQLAMDRGLLKRVSMAGCSLIIIVLFSFSSLIIFSNSVDLNIGKILGTKNRDYYTQAELESFQFVYGYQGSAALYSDGPTIIYFHKDPKANLATPSTVNFNFDVEPRREAYLLFRKQEYYSRGQLGYAIGPQPFIYKVGKSPDIEAIWAGQLKVYDNQSVEIYLTR